MRRRPASLIVPWQTTGAEVGTGNGASGAGSNGTSAPERQRNLLVW